MIYVHTLQCPPRLMVLLINGTIKLTTMGNSEMLGYDQEK